MAETAEETVARLRSALINIQRQTHMSSIWGGMATKFLPMPPFRVKRVAEFCKKALEGED
jgi:hypothetical protein